MVAFPSCPGNSCQDPFGLGSARGRRQCILRPVFLRELLQPVSALRGAGPAIVPRLARLGIATVADLLSHFPRDYEDRSRFVPFSRFAAEPRVFTIAHVTGHEWFGFGRNRTLKIRVADESSEAILICFNRPFLEKSLPVGGRVLVGGKFQFRYGEIQSSAFDAEKLEEGKDPDRGLLALYPLTEGVNQGTVRRLMRAALSGYGERVEDELGPDLIASRTLMAKADALATLHAPKTPAERDEARRTLAYEELFWFQLAVARRAQARKRQTSRRPPDTGLLERRLLERLPFSLTADQRKSLDEIVSDMSGAHPMARLLQGDVGSGKTIVALLAALHAVERGSQAAIMAPTEILARQHAATAARLLEPLGVRLAFLSGNVDDAARAPLLKALASGEVHIAIGTHALFSADVVYRNLGLAVVDEQQRFGVLQRLALSRKGEIPDLLMMTATPIPRSLALTMFGDLMVSEIKTMPPGRKPVKTHLAKAGNEARVYEFVRRLLAEGKQAYFVYPLVSESDRLELKNAEAMAEKLAKEQYPEYSVGLVHSRLKEDVKRAAMDDFVSGRTRILVATTVVEVGVDVPDAAVMVVEHAERFGLSALHQLRGRVGRGEAQSYCFLIYSENPGQDATARLKAMLETTDGFELAERDLLIRGPGELTGTAQSGALHLKIADPVRDFDLLKDARADAFALVESDPGFLEPEHAVYRAVLERAPPFGEAGTVQS